MTNVITVKEIEKSKKVMYHHPRWYHDTKYGAYKSLYDAIKEISSSNDFKLDITSTIARHYTKTGYPSDMSTPSRKEFIDWLIQKRKYQYLIIRYTGSEGGTDKGNLKIKLFLYFRGY